MDTITTGKWIGKLNEGLAPRELEAVLHSANDLKVKEISRLMGISPSTVSKRLDDARFKFGSRTVRGLVAEAFRRGIIAPALCMVIALLMGLQHNPSAVRRPSAPRRIETFSAVRRIESAVVA